MENKFRIFAEYLYCQITKDNVVKQLTPENLIDSVQNGWKLLLKSVYDMPTEIQLKIVDELRYNRQLNDSFRDFEDHKQFHVTSESRNRKTVETAMISYVYRKSDGSLHGDWTRLVNRFNKQYVKSLGYDLGSEFCYKIDSKNYKEYIDLLDSEYAVKE